MSTNSIWTLVMSLRGIYTWVVSNLSLLTTYIMWHTGWNVIQGWTDTATLRTLYLTCIRPHLEYACQLWAPYTKSTGIDELEKVQKYACKVCLKRWDYLQDAVTWSSAQCIRLLTIIYFFRLGCSSRTIWSTLDILMHWGTVDPFQELLLQVLICSHFLE